MKKIVVALLLLAILAPVFAQQGGMGREEDMEHEMLEVEREINDLLRNYFGRPGRASIGDVGLNDIRDLAARASVLEQQRRYIAKARLSSFAMPGLGQFATDRDLEGVLFLAGDLVVAAGTIVGVHFTLPATVRFDATGATGLNYFTNSYANIETAWKALSFEQLLPAAGVMTAGSIVSGLLRWWSSSHAAEAARENIADGSVTFEPRPYLFLGRRLGLGVGLRY